MFKKISNTGRNGGKPFGWNHTTFGDKFDFRPMNEAFRRWVGVDFIGVPLVHAVDCAAVSRSVGALVDEAPVFRREGAGAERVASRAGGSAAWERSTGARAGGARESRAQEQPSDMVLVTKVERKADERCAAVVDKLLSKTSRPILLMPESSSGDMGRRIGIAWHESRETERAIELAMPALRAAEEVHIFIVNGFGANGVKTGKAIRRMKECGLKVTSTIVDRGRCGIGEAFLNMARATNCDLLVKGAYTNGPLKRRLYGNTTRHVMENSSVPVFMAR